MPRFEVKDNNIYDNNKEGTVFEQYSEINFECICDSLNNMELERLHYKRELATLKHRIRELVK